MDVLDPVQVGLSYTGGGIKTDCNLTICSTEITNAGTINSAYITEDCSGEEWYRMVTVVEGTIVEETIVEETIVEETIVEETIVAAVAAVAV